MPNTWVLHHFAFAYLKPVGKQILYVSGLPLVLNVL